MPHTFVILGASGDLTHRKLVPALYHLFRKGRLPKDTRIVGFSRTEFTHEAWRNDLAKAVARFVGNDFDSAAVGYASRKTFTTTRATSAKPKTSPRSPSCSTKSRSSATARDVYYLATAPQFYGPAVEQLGRAGLADENGGQRRVIIEKPFGTDLASAKQLNNVVHAVFSEQQVYRIDHYLGKETVQNLLVLRFANTIFEPIWNRNYIDHVQITVAEEVDVGRRAGYYDSAGVMRDMFQNHLLQLVMITAMEAPVRYEADAVRNEKVKVLQAIRPLQRRRHPPRHAPRPVSRVLRLPKACRPGSHTATFAAIKLWIDNWRWQGVPFYLRSGKAMSCRTTQIVVQFHEPPHMLFPGWPEERYRSQSAGDSGAAGRRNSAGIRNQSARRRHAASGRPRSTSATSASSAA